MRPEAGDIMPGSNGLRKVRWKLPGQGKQGGLRVIYYWDPPVEKIYIIFAYKKSKQTDLSPAQVKVLAKLVQENLK